MSEDHDATAPSVDHGDEHDSVEDRAEARKSKRTDHVENILDETESLFRDRKYPVRSEELATEYANHPIDLANETESLGSVFDRMTDREEFESSDEVREALYNELTGEAEGESEGEYNEERDVEQIADAEHDDDAGNL